MKKLPRETKAEYRARVHALTGCRFFEIPQARTGTDDSFVWCPVVARRGGSAVVRVVEDHPDHHCPYVTGADGDCICPAPGPFGYVRIDYQGACDRIAAAQAREGAL